MGKYLESRNEEIKKYFKILCSEFPEWIEEYIAAPELQRIGRIGNTCGTEYAPFFNVRYFYSNLDHSVGVALIVWNFTHDKKQTLAGLFHDIAVPVFKHSIDFMNGDSEKQESTEEKTVSIIQNSKVIMKLLARDKIKLEEVSDYKLYPLADNHSPRLSADRMEYNFSSGLTFKRVWELDSIKEVYNDLTICKNEQNFDEFCFKNAKICEKYIKTVSKLWPCWICEEDRTTMQFLADMCKSLNIINRLSVDDLYSKSEKEILELFENNGDKYLETAWKNFKKCKKVKKCGGYVDDKYCSNVKTKERYLTPLAMADGSPRRIYDISKKAQKCIDKYKKISKGGYYLCFDFEFKPYKN